MLTLIPREVFVGDTAEIVYSFIPDNSILQIINPSGSEKQVTVEIPHDYSVFDSMLDICTVSKISVDVTQADCVIHVIFTPWKTGVLDFPPFDLLDAVSLFDTVQNSKLNANHSNTAQNLITSKTTSNDASQIQCIIDIPSVNISSIVEKTGRSSLQKIEPPILVPGTTYAVYACVVGIVFFLVLIIVIAVRFRRFKNKIGSFLGHIYLPRYARKALRKLKKLQKNLTSFTLASVSGELSKILRDYLESRFAYPFTAVSTPEIMRVFSTLTAKTANETQENLFFEISSLCVRLDYLRFSGKGEIPAVQKVAAPNAVVDVVTNVTTDKTSEADKSSETAKSSEAVTLCETIKSFIMRLEADDAAL